MLIPAATGAAARFAALSARAKLQFAVGVAALVAVLVALTLTTRQGDYRLLFSSLSEKDGGQIIEKLQQLNVPYRFGEGNGAILVPSDKVYELRMKLTSAGLPKSAESGYEFLDQSPTFGVTQRRESMNLQRAREGELMRTIQTLDSVAAARVHLAMPNQNGFFREQERASASVVLTLHPGRTLDRAQVAGIVHLVSRSVPDLKATDVSVIDHTGALLNPTDGGAGGGLDALQLDYRRQVEDGLRKRVLDLIEPVMGRDNLRATVTAEIDFSQVESTAEEFRPNQGAEAAATVRAVRTEETLTPGTAVPSGVPGAASNQPPVPATAPVNGAAVPLQAAQGGAAGGNGRREAETRYEVDRTVRVTRAGSGVVKRLNAAVVVNHRTSVDAKGRSTTTPLSGAELEQLTALVRQGIGFDTRRGDSVQVINAPFHAEPVTPPAPVPVWQQPWVQDLLRVGLAPAALVLVGLLALFGFVRPAMKAVAGPKPARGARLDAVVGDAAETLSAPVATPALAAPQTNIRLDTARALAQQNPAAVANIMRGWVNGDAPA
ncbi:MAG: flagellar basal-body MS-ring/collar protein FliF [Rubrivivax sp.]